MEKQRKRILFVITKSNFGGAQRNVFELATHVSKDEYDVCVAFGGEGLLKQKLEGAGVRTRTIHSFERDINVFKEFRAFFELRSLMREFRPDTVHLHSSKAGGLGSLVARTCNVPRIIFTAHGWPFFESRNIVWRCAVWILSWFTALLSHTVILVSEYDFVRTRMPFVKKKCVVIHTGIGKVEFLEREKAREFLFSKEELARHESDLFLVTTAELTRNKNLFIAIDAVIEFNKTATQKIFYTIIGDGELRDELMEHIKKHNAENTIKLSGYVDDARSYLSAFDMFLLSSHKEGLPYAVLEAGCAGLPVIGSNVGGIPEILSDETYGMLIDPRITKEIVRALAHYTHSDTRARHGASLKAHITNTFSIENMRHRTYSYYDKNNLTQ